MWCGVLWCAVVWYSVVWCGVVVLYDSTACKHDDVIWQNMVKWCDAGYRWMAL